MQQGYAITIQGAHWTIHYNSRWLYYASINAFNWSKCSYYGHPSLFLSAYIIIFIYFLILTSRKLSPIIVLILFIALLYFLVQHDNQLLFYYLVTFIYHLILGVLLGEVLQSSWTIFKLTFRRPIPSWDGRTLTELTRIPTFLFSTLWIAINIFTIYLMLIFTI